MKFTFLVCFTLAFLPSISTAQKKDRPTSKGCGAAIPINMALPSAVDSYNALTMYCDVGHVFCDYTKDTSSHNHDVRMQIWDTDESVLSHYTAAPQIKQMKVASKVMIDLAKHYDELIAKRDKTVMQAPYIFATIINIQGAEANRQAIAFLRPFAEAIKLELLKK